MTCYHQPSLQPGAVMDHVLEKCAVFSMKTREDVATLASSTSSGLSPQGGCPRDCGWSVQQFKMGWVAASDISHRSCSLVSILHGCEVRAASRQPEQQLFITRIAQWRCGHQ